MAAVPILLLAPTNLQSPHRHLSRLTRCGPQLIAAKWRYAVTDRHRSTRRGEPRELKLQCVDFCQVAAGVMVAAALAASEPEPAARVGVAGPASAQVDDRCEVLPLPQRGDTNAVARE